MSTFLYASIVVSLARLRRDRCADCAKRRVLFVLTVNGENQGLALCAVCAGLR